MPPSPSNVTIAMDVIEQPSWDKSSTNDSSSPVPIEEQSQLPSPASTHTKTVTPPPSEHKKQPQPTTMLTLESIRTMSPNDMSFEAICFIMKDQPADLIGSPIETETRSVQGYAGLWFCSYEHAAACKSAFNKQFINVKLGIVSSPSNSRLKRSNSKTKDHTRPDKSMPTRSSRRLAQLAAPVPLELPDDELYGGNNNNSSSDMESPRAKRSRKLKPRTTTATQYGTLSTEQLSQLTAFCESHAWLETFDMYLDRVEQISAANKRNVLRQVTLLVAGKCIEYSHWPQGVAFNQAHVQVHLGLDLVQLLSNADDFEREHGRDLGNGWLMRHPIQKLINYQRHVLEELEPSGKAAVDE